MSRPAARREGPRPLEWIETATALLRSAPPGALLCYYTGSTTCVLGLLFFWTDMSRGAFAAGHLIESAFSAAALYIWMKCWQAAFFSKLRAHLLMEPEAPWTLRRMTRMVAAQAAFQPLGLCLRFIAGNILVPYIWTYSLFIGAAIRGDGTEPSLHAIGGGALREASLWWRQTHLAMLCLFGFAVVIVLNLFTVALVLPFLLRIFLGIESPFTRDAWAMMNSTFVAAVLAITYLCFDPLRKALYVVRHFQGASLHSGEDLRVALKAIRARSRAAVAAVVLLGSLLAAPVGRLHAANPAPVSPPPSQVDSGQLSDSLDRVLERREYGWRFPRVAETESEQKSWFASLIESAGKSISRWFKSTWKKVEGWTRRLRSNPDGSDRSLGGVEWGFMAYAVLILLIIALLIIVVSLLWRSRHRRVKVATAESVPVTPDLREENVTADQLPEDGWLSLGRELIRNGDLRLAIRAFYLATLAHLGQRELIRLARYKSNHDYDSELQRRARGNSGLLEAFDATLLAFERVWYGDHLATPQILEIVSRNMERIRAC